MKKAFEKLVEALWKFGNAGLVPCSVILLVPDEVIRASTVGVLQLKNACPQAFFDRAKEREESQSASPIPFAPVVKAAIANLVTNMHGKRYTLIIMHPSQEIEDVVISSGKQIDAVSGQTVSGWGVGMIALSTHKTSAGIEYVVPRSHQRIAA